MRLVRIRRLSPLALAGRTRRLAPPQVAGRDRHHAPTSPSSNQATPRSEEIDRVAVVGHPIGEFQVRPGAHTLGVDRLPIQGWPLLQHDLPFGVDRIVLESAGQTPLPDQGEPRSQPRARRCHRPGDGQPPVTPCGPDEDDDLTEVACSHRLSGSRRFNARGARANLRHPCAFVGGTGIEPATRAV